MIAIATRAVRAPLGTPGAAGPVSFANPANSMATPRRTAVPAIIAAAELTATKLRG